VTVRVRFAPSPTGYLHVGGARTALFNWLYARSAGGAFILRIEDTDVERSSTDMVTGILDSLKWLGLDWDEGPGVGGPHAPYFQTERLPRYRAAAQRLVDSGHAYYCYCRPEDLKAKRAAAEQAGGAYTYDRTCRALSPDEIRAREAAGQPRAVRFLVPAGRTSFADLVHGPIDFDNATISSAPLEGPPMRRHASHLPTRRREIGWKISSNTGSPIPVEPADSMSGSANHSPSTGRCPARNKRSAICVIASTFAAIRAGSSLVPERYGPATRISNGFGAGVEFCTCVSRGWCRSKRAAVLLNGSRSV